MALESNNRAADAAGLCTKSKCNDVETAELHQNIQRHGAEHQGTIENKRMSGASENYHKQTVRKHSSGFSFKRKTSNATLAVSAKNHSSSNVSSVHQDNFTSTPLSPSSAVNKISVHSSSFPAKDRAFLSKSEMETSASLPQSIGFKSDSYLGTSHGPVRGMRNGEGNGSLSSCDISPILGQNRSQNASFSSSKVAAHTMIGESVDTRSVGVNILQDNGREEEVCIATSAPVINVTAKTFVTAQQSSNLTTSCSKQRNVNKAVSEWDTPISTEASQSIVDSIANASSKASSDSKAVKRKRKFPGPAGVLPKLVN